MLLIIVVIHYLYIFSFNYMSKYVDHILQLLVTYIMLYVLTKLRCQYNFFGCLENVFNSIRKLNFSLHTSILCLHLQMKQHIQYDNNKLHCQISSKVFQIQIMCMCSYSYTYSLKVGGILCLKVGVISLQGVGLRFYYYYYLFFWGVHTNTR